MRVACVSLKADCVALYTQVRGALFFFGPADWLSALREGPETG